ncbi:pyruvate kinase [Aliarcobacter trophiarum LMG 25534]|uniref:Pyruvate kinase n=1 Tax=Aliarcobacter trophiarum LMG 25534 TaxID=1032241 RepID=A0AAD0VLD5_9BACT|nr:pyruvate kinase [Aliarcobacter trophiarum]AXK48079.1 pyruvate kinase I [Aliarcobacter trophiarum LMG 25534]RXJ93240.1 pyruvate kinase [Aliarcobacter trophiarum LMG 25534]
MDKKTKILATLGPASNSLEMIEKLIDAGANMFRLNFSHGSHEYHQETLDNIRQAMKNKSKIVGILQDISGPKIRVGELKEPFNLESGDVITFYDKEIIGEKKAPKDYIVSINYPDILKKIKVDEYIYLYDGIIRAKVIETTPKVKARIENSGTLSSRKGVNFPNTVINIEVITKKDEQDIAWGVKNRVDYFAISFVQSAKDMKRARELLNGYDGKLIAKIEKFDAVSNIKEIIDASDGIMVARGDLGIEVPYYDVPTIQKMLIRKSNAAGIPVITATQMLLSMTQNERATRAEISDVANAVLDGTDIVMLSEESAVGENPTNVVETMHNIILKTEEIFNHKKRDHMPYLDEFDVIQATVTKLADDLKADGILSLTSSGNSARKMSRYKPKTPLYTFAHNSETLTRLSALWGVIPITTIKEAQASKMIQKMLRSLEKRGILNKKGLYICTVGYPVGIPGSTNTIKILTPSEIGYYMNFKENREKSKIEKKEKKYK